MLPRRPWRGLGASLSFAWGLALQRREGRPPAEGGWAAALVRRDGPEASTASGRRGRERTARCRSERGWPIHGPRQSVGRNAADARTGTLEAPCELLVVRWERE